MANAALRLEQALATYRATCFYLSRWAKALQIPHLTPRFPIAGPIVHGEKLDDYLAKNPEAIGEQFTGPAELREVLTRTVGNVRLHFPLMIGAWAQHSRRIYRVSEDLQLLFDGTDVENIDLRSVRWPFSAFAIAPERPLIDSTGRRHDCILVAIDDEGDGRSSTLRILTLTDALDKLPTLDERTRFTVEQHLRKGKWMKAQNVCHAGVQPHGRDDIGSYFLFGEAHHVHDKLQDELPNVELQEASDPMWTTLVRLVIGLAFYTTSKPNQRHRQSEWRQTSSGLPRLPLNQRRRVTDGAQSCLVEHVEVLTLEERAALEYLGQSYCRPRHELTCQCVRTGHWRFKPYQALNPLAEKDVWVRPTKIREDLPLRPKGE